MDLLCANEDGLLTIVETKLWRNPEARRTVVAQIVSYAAALSKMSYEELATSVAEAAGIQGDGLSVKLKAANPNFNITSFHDQVVRNLRAGRFLLLIMGDGIKEDVESMSDFLQNQPRLGFTLALAEVGIYRFGADAEDLLLESRIVCRTREIMRAIVEIRGAQVEVTTPVEPPAPTSASRRFTITEEEFLRELMESEGSEAGAFVKEVIEQAPSHDLTIDWKQSGPLLKFVDPGSGVFFTLGGFSTDGNFGHLSRFANRCDELRFPDEVWMTYFNAIVKLIPGASIKHFKSKTGTEWEDVVYAGPQSPLVAIMQKSNRFWEAVDAAVAAVKKHLSKSVH